MNKLGTLVLVDLENLKTPMRKTEKRYLEPKVDVMMIQEALRKTLHDTHYHFIAFAKRYATGDVRYGKNIRFIDFLKSQQFEVVAKTTKKLRNKIIVDGKDQVYSYEECDMDAEIVHVIHTVGKNYSRIILMSGDSDMKCALDYITQEHGTEVVIIAHKENLSRVYKDYRCIYLHELMDTRYAQKQKD